MSYANILVAIDLSEESRQVLDTASRIAARNGATLHLASIIRPLANVYGGLDMAPIATGTVSFEESAMAQANQQLVALAARYGIPEDRIHVVLGSPAHEIRDIAEQAKADLIVLGSHGRHGIGLLLGSTANAVLHGANCDILAVRIEFDD